ncbi:hypothetical protein JOD01_003491, partial [Brevibacillus fulvus]|nr:hypothetical protein [Brevibacillus fulvus]
GLVTEKLLQVGVKSFFYAQKTLLLKGLDLCKRLDYFLWDPLNSSFDLSSGTS